LTRLRETPVASHFCSSQGEFIMNKSQLVDALAKSADITKAKAAHVLDALLDLITTAIAQGQSVALIGFGTFKTALRRAREGRNPATGAKIQIPSMRLPRFAAGAVLKGVVSGKRPAPKRAARKTSAKQAARKTSTAKRAARPVTKAANKKPARKK
jgi:DNA-binding protein HU-beta